MPEQAGVLAPRTELEQGVVQLDWGSGSTRKGSGYVREQKQRDGKRGEGSSSQERLRPAGIAGEECLGRRELGARKVSGAEGKEAVDNAKKTNLQLERPLQ